MINIEHGTYARDGFELAMHLAVAKRRFVAVLGPSGAGKTTLFNVIAGFEPLQAGRIVLNGADHTRTPPGDRPVSLVFQEANSFPHLTARQNVALGIRPSLRLSQDEWSSVDASLARVGLSHLAERKPGEMSGGERQRIALARVLVRKQPILLLDEAFAALGPALRADMLELVKSLQKEQGLTVLMITHQPEDAREVADGVIFVDAGVVRPVEETFRFFRLGDDAVRRYLGEMA